MFANDLVASIVELSEKVRRGEVKFAQVWEAVSQRMTAVTGSPHEQSDEAVVGALTGLATELTIAPSCGNGRRSPAISPGRSASVRAPGSSGPTSTGHSGGSPDCNTPPRRPTSGPTQQRRSKRTNITRLDLQRN